MIRLAEAGKVQTVIVKDMSRMGRDYLKVGYYTESFFAERDIRYIAINDGIDSNKGDNDFTPFRNLFNDFYARDTSKKIRAVMRAKGNAGEHLCTNPPYGYMKDPDNRKRWIVDGEAAEVVKRIFALCLDGYGPSQIARILKEDKVITPTIHFQQTGRATRNTPPDKPRTVTLKITFKPDESRTLIASKAVVTTNLQPQEPQTIPVVLDKLDGAPMLFESFTDNRPDQYRFDGTSPTELRGGGSVTVNVTPFKKAEEHPINQ